ncbi:hypothetical protein MKX50_01320 [Paenibacillus sp. FSL W8-0186]|uniref:NACHT domain-containing protein n=1 Tax=Paenibacillus sp. FSL W8-0186 TaxID=2921709 RepID=UPI0030D05FBE
MGDYSFSRFNSRDFEHFIQALTRKIMGNGTIIFGDGPDGGREATFEGSCPFPSATDNWSGYWVVQAKYKNRTDDESDFSWLKRHFKNEMNKFIENKKKGLKVPNNYLFFTNAILTGTQDTGGRDRISKICKEYEDTIPNIKIFGYDDLCRFLDDNRDIATTYSSFTLPGDILFELTNTLKKLNECSSNHMDLLTRFLEKEFKEDLTSRLEQGGQLTDEKVNLEKVFVDLNIVSIDPKKRRIEGERFVKKCIELGNNLNKPDNENLNESRLVLIGGPGQGKSTLTQFLSQIYRAFFLEKNSECKIMEEVSGFIKQFKDLDIEVPNCIRFPIRIVLKDYAGWMVKQKEQFSVIEYLKYKIEAKGKGQISLMDIRKILGSLSILFIFDGLDEVPVTSNREDVLNEINDFLDIELRRVNCDSIVIGTTRPQGYSKEFDSTKFDHYQLADLSEEDCLKYLEKLMDNFDNSLEQKASYMNILSKALNDDGIKRLMKSPLQATIMAILVRSGGEPPRNRYNLFTQYYTTILNRERQKGVVTVLNDEYNEYIDLIHYKLGFMLQKNSEDYDNPSSSVSYQEFGEFVLEILVDEMGIDTEKANKFKEDILFAITDRLVFISEVEDSRVGFSIRSMQEYFAANYYLHNQPDEIIPNKIRIIAKNIYWRNTFLFAMGYLAKYKSYLIDVVFSICGELNGNNQDYAAITTEKITKIGSWLALDLLCEGVFRSRQKQENKFCNLLEELFKIAPSTNHSYFSKLPDSIQERFVEKFIEKYISQSSSIREAVTAWSIACSLLINRNNRMEDLIEKYWPKNNDEEIFLLKFMVQEGAKTSSFVLKKLISSIERNEVTTYFNELDDDTLLENLLVFEFSPKVQEYLLEITFFASLDSSFSRNKRTLEFINLISRREIIDLSSQDISVSLISDRNNEIIMDNFKDISAYLISTKNDNPNVPRLRDLFKDFGIEYLFALLNFTVTPSEENLYLLSDVLNNTDQIRMNILINNNARFNWIIKKLLLIYENVGQLQKNQLINEIGDKSNWIAFERKVQEDNLNLSDNDFTLINYSLKGFSKGTSISTFINDIYRPYTGKFNSNISHILFLNFVCFGYSNDIEKEPYVSDEVLDEIVTATINIPNDYRILINRVWGTLIQIISAEQLFRLLQKREIDIFQGITIEDTIIFPLLSANINDNYQKILSAINIYNKETSLICLLPYLLALQGMNKVSVNFNHEFLLNLKFSQPKNEISRLLLLLIFFHSNETVNLNKLIDEVIILVKGNYKIATHIINLLEKIKSSSAGIVEMVYRIHYELNLNYSENINILSLYEEYLKEMIENYPTELRSKI